MSDQDLTNFIAHHDDQLELDDTSDDTIIDLDIDYDDVENK